MRFCLTHLVAVCLMASACSGNVDLVPVRGYARTVLAVQHLQQEAMLCVPTSAAMVMTFYGDPHPPRLLKSLSAGNPYDPSAAFNDYTITSYFDLIKAARALGYDWVQGDYPDNNAGFEEGIALIETELRAGHPVLVDATLPTGHTFVIRGFDLNSHQLFVVDPDQPAPGVRVLSFAEFKAVWNEHAYNNNIRAMIITRPRASSPWT